MFERGGEVGGLPEGGLKLRRDDDIVHPEADSWPEGASADEDDGK